MDIVDDYLDLRCPVEDLEVPDEQIDVDVDLPDENQDNRTDVDSPDDGDHREEKEGTADKAVWYSFRKLSGTYLQSRGPLE